MLCRPGEMSFEVGDQALGLPEMGPKRQKGPQSGCENSTLPKKARQSKGSIKKKYWVPLGPSQEMKFLGSGDRSPRFLQPWCCVGVGGGWRWGCSGYGRPCGGPGDHRSLGGGGGTTGNLTCERGQAVRVMVMSAVGSGWLLGMDITAQTFLPLVPKIKMATPHRHT